MQLEEARGQLATAVTDSQTHLSGQAEASRVTIEEFEQTLLSHIGDLAGGIVELGEKNGLTQDDLETAVAGVARAAQLDGVTATTTALREELDEVVVSLGEMRAEFNGLQAAIEKRVDDAALALAETLVAVITSMPAVQSAPTISYDFADDVAEQVLAAEPVVESAAASGDKPDEESAVTLPASAAADGLDDLESAFGEPRTDEPPVDAPQFGAPEFDEPQFDEPQPGEQSDAGRRKGIFRR